MGWLLNYTIGSIVASFIIVKIFDYLFAGVVSGLLNIVRCLLFVGTWAVVTSQAGMHGFRKHIRRLRQGHAEVVEAFAHHEKR